MSISLKILKPMAVISVIAATSILFFNIIQFSSFVDSYIEDELERSVLKASDEIDRLRYKSRTTVLYYVNDDELIDAMSRGEQKAVLKRALELFAETDVESFTIVDANAIILARTHKPEFYGDDVSDMAVVRAALEGNATVGVARGISTSISARAASPVYDDQGRLVGAVFAGDRLDTEKFVDRLETFTGCEVTVFVDDVRVATTLYGESGERATGSAVPGYIEKVIPAGNNITRALGYQGRELMARHLPVTGADGEIVGIVAIGRYTTEKWDMVKSFILTGFLITAVIILGSILIILFVSRQIAAPIKQSIDQANYDELTGIFNRRFFEEQLRRLMKILSRSGGTISFMMIDIDFFKKYNDTYGHVKGDDCLRAVAAVITETLSRTGDLVGRYGGEEFVAALPNTDKEGARVIAEKLLEGMRNLGIPHATSDVSEHVTISVGVTTGKVDYTLDTVDFIRRADYMLYESKRNGRNTYTFGEM